MELTRKSRRRAVGFARDERGMAAVEFALIAPTLIVLFMGVFEMTLRFRAVEEATRYVHQVADLTSRDKTLTTADLSAIYDASLHMMKPLTTTDRLSMDVAAIGYQNNEDYDPYLLWRRAVGTEIPLDLDKARGLGIQGESVIRVAISYRYDSPLTSLFSGPTIEIKREAYARPREVRLVTMDGAIDHGGAIEYFTGTEIPE
ncbi:hypothetical protein GC169_08230 [bacterium]|nr:hypothetical protein [bacterium]